MARAPRESGFAMLLVFLMAAMIAITLYWQIPRVAFQAQRQKEQLLIERGEQYQRAIQLFVRANNRYPQKIEDLENFNNRRYLRHRFNDPMTGKDEWRLIHVNAAGVFTDSIANKKKTDKPDAQASQNTFVGEQAYLAPDATQQGSQVTSAATRRRQSEGGAAPVGPDGQPLIPPPNQQALNAPPPFPTPGGQPGVPGNLQPGIPGQPGQNPNNLQLANQQQPGQPLIPGVPGTPGQPPFPLGTPAGGNPGIPVANNNLNNLNNTSQAFPQQPGAPQQPVIPPQPPFPQPGAGGFPQPGAIQNRSQAGVGQNANTASSSFVDSSSSFVGSSSSFVGGASSFVGSATTGAPMPGNPNPFAQPGFPQPGAQAGFPQPGAQPGFNQPGFSQPGFAPQNFSQPAQPPGFAQPGAQFNSVNPVNNQTATSAVPAGVTGNPTTQSAAASMINGILTGARPGGIGGGPATTTTGPQGQQIGAGIAGVASTSEAPAIMEYNEHDHYNEWEFIFDVSKQKPTANPTAINGVPGTPAGALGSVPGGTPGTPVGIATQPGGATATASPFGAATPTSSPFGATPGAATASGTAAGTTPGGVLAQQQSPIPPWFRFGEP